jgi:hypothetical protein
LLPGLSIGARKLALDGFVHKVPSIEIIAQIEDATGELVDLEKIDRARLLCVGKLEKWLSDQDEARLLSRVDDSAINQNTMAVALEKLAGLCYKMVGSISDDMEAIEAESDPVKKALIKNALLKQMGDLSVVSGNTVRAQVMIAKFAIELPFRKDQLYGKKETPRSEITPEFVLEMERMLGVLPYDENFEPQPIEADQV